MACNQNCNDSQPVGIYTNNNDSCGGCNPNQVDASCVIYTGATLTCSGAPTNASVEAVIQIIDAKLCEVTGDYSGYNVSCLTPVITQKDFVEKISAFVCLQRADFDTFVGTTYVNGITNLQTQINTITGPRGITSCAEVGIIPADNLTVVLNKLSNSECAIYQLINPSTANWSQCFTLVGAPPSNIVQGFNTVLDQICQVKALVGSGGSGTLPTFNNVGSCLASPGATDSLVDTIIKLRNRVCLSPTFNAANLAASTCVQFSGASSLEDIIQAQNSQIDGISLNSVRAASSAFSLAPIDTNNLCLGQRISLNSAVIDRNVAYGAADGTPGTLQDKLAAGANISLDFGTLNPGRVTITSSGSGSSVDEKVKASAGDPTAGYLYDKVSVNNLDPFVTLLINNVTTSAQFAPSFDLEAALDAIFDILETDSVRKARFCALVSSCPVACAPPTNGSVTFQ